MYSLLLVILYLAFISLGLPDSLLGAGWPVMRGELNVPISYAGVISMLIAGGTIVSSLCSERLTTRFGAGAVTAVSVLMTAVALLGFSLSGAYWMLCLWAIPYGLGAGAVDAALNHYVALHCKSRHMNWLHCFWGVGAAVSPYIMSGALGGGLGWSGGYRIVFYVQIALTAILFCSLPLWKKTATAAGADAQPRPLGIRRAVRVPGVKAVLIAFFAYCALEQTAGLWASSYLAEYRGIEAGTAARFASFFFIGITAGRFLCGFISDRLGDRRLIRIGIGVLVFGILLIGLPVPWTPLPLIGLIVVGFGCAPIYPCVIHATPANFGAANSQAIIGIQMASAYVGTTFMPPLFGLIAEYVDIGLYPLYLILFAVLMLGMTELLNRIVGKNTLAAASGTEEAGTETPLGETDEAAGRPDGSETGNGEK